MIKFLQAADTLKIADLVKKTEALSTKIAELEKNQSIWENLIKTLDVIVWPIALIVCLYLFKKQIGSIIDRFESANVSASGLAFKLQQTTKLIGTGSTDVLAKSNDRIIPKDGGSIIPKDGGSIIPKSSNTIIPKRNHAESPYQMLIELQDAIQDKLKQKAAQEGVTLNAASNFALVNDLADQNIIDSHSASKIKALIELNTMGLNSPETTHEQVSQMKKLFNNISL
jgi:hypothetical protein